MIRSVTGLVLCGGKSLRMGTDKSLLDYHGKPQRAYLYELLKQYCPPTFLSCSREQAATIDAQYEVIIDDEAADKAGPLSGLLSAHKAMPAVDFLVLGCDYPLVATYEIETLLHAGATGRSAAFRNAAGFVEPLVSLWTRHDLAILSSNPARYHHSMRRFLEEINAMIRTHPQPGNLVSADTMEDYLRIRDQLRNRS